MQNRVREIAELVSILGEKLTADRLGISTETVSRRMREYRAEGRPTAKMLNFDIEIAPSVAYFFNPWQTNLMPDMIIRPWYVLSWSAKWLFDCDMINATITPEETKTQDDRRIVKQLWDLFDEADILIAHHGDRFDIPKMNTRFLLHDLGIPSPYQSIDTRKIAARKFGFNHNKLDALGEEFGLGRKIKTDFNLWVRCDNGEQKALTEMQTYNDQDVYLLEEVYLKLRPWMNSHPNMNNYNDDKVCSHCGSYDLTFKGHYTTVVNRYATEVCGNCGAFTKKIGSNYSGLAR